MNERPSEPQILRSPRPVLLIGGGAVRADRILHLTGLAGAVAAADGGADSLRRAGIRPDAVVGDLDSISAEALAALPGEVVHRIAEQDSTDFDKCLRHITAPLILGYGFLGARVDHQLAAMTVLARYPERRCVLIGEEDVLTLCPPDIALDLAPGSRISLFPLGPVAGRSTGLRWPISGIDFDPTGRVGTSNEVSGPVRLFFDAPRMLLILPVRTLEPLLAALCATCASWPAPA